MSSIYVFLCDIHEHLSIHICIYIMSTYVRINKTRTKHINKLYCYNPENIKLCDNIPIYKKVDDYDELYNIIDDEIGFDLLESFCNSVIVVTESAGYYDDTDYSPYIRAHTLHVQTITLLETQIPTVKYLEIAEICMSCEFKYSLSWLFPNLEELYIH